MSDWIEWDGKVAKSPANGYVDIELRNGEMQPHEEAVTKRWMHVDGEWRNKDIIRYRPCKPTA